MSLREQRSIVSGKEITVSFGGADVVKAVDIDLFGREIHAIVGENGAGKSSLAKVLAGVYQARLGTIELYGEPIKFDSPRDALKRGVALIHQEPHTFGELDVAENIFIGHHPKRWRLVSWSDVYQRAQAILDDLALDLNPRAAVGGLSVAHQQMVELASAMSHDAEVWIFDETTAPLTPKEVDELFVVMRRLRDRGCAVAMVTHHLEEVFEIADRITILRDGEKVAELKPSETTPSEVVQIMVGRELSGEKFVGQGVEGEVVLGVNGISGHGFTDISFSVKAGEVVCLAGLVGAGRTEVADAIFGINQLFGGHVVFCREQVLRPSAEKSIQMGVAYVPEDRRKHGLLMPLSITFNSTLSFLSKLSQRGWVKKERLNEETTALTKRMNLACRTLEQPVEELSGGNQQKVVLSKWLMTQPRLLILDEPTRGVDVGAKHEVHQLIRDQADGGMGVLMVSSDLTEVLALADRVLVMRSGRIAAEFMGSEVTQEQIMFAATGKELAIGA